MFGIGDQDFPAFAPRHACLDELQQVAVEGVAGHARPFLQRACAGRAVRQPADDGEAPRVGERRCDLLATPVFSRRVCAEAFPHRLQQGGGRCDLAIRFGVVEDMQALAPGLDQSPRLQAAEFLAGARQAEAQAVGQMPDRLVG